MNDEHLNGRSTPVAKCQSDVVVESSPRAKFAASEQPLPQHFELTECATLSLVDAAKVLGIHRSTAWDLHKRGKFPIPILEVGHRLRVSRVHLEHFLATGEPVLSSKAD
jgi:Helix-turn-helix domain